MMIGIGNKSVTSRTGWEGLLYQFALIIPRS
jgi:hypothetical protein